MPNAVSGTYDVAFTHEVPRLTVDAAYLVEEGDMVTFKDVNHAYVAAVPKHHLLYAVRR